MGNLLALPAPYIQRPELEKQLLKALSISQSEHTLIHAGVWGAGGVGKTVLVTALAFTPEIQKMFPNGIHWGYLPLDSSNMFRLSSGGIFTLSDVFSSIPNSLDFLPEEPALLVLDDVSDSPATNQVLAAIHRFQNKLPHKTVVITRDLNVLQKANCQEILHVSVLGKSEGISLLAEVFGETEIRANISQAEEIVNLVDGHPLFLRLLANTAKRQNLSLLNAFEFIKSLMKNQNIRSNTTTLGETLEQVYAVMVKQEGDEIGQHFKQIGVFVEDTSFPQDALEQIWGIQEPITTSIIEIFINLSLLGQDDTGYFYQHDLVHDFARTMLVNDLGLSKNTFLRHATYYHQIVEQKGHSESVLRHLPNILAAFHWAMSQISQVAGLPPIKIFLSHASSDDKMALDIADRLENAGANVWIDNKNIPLGERWDRIVWKALEETEVMIILLSPSAMVSENVADELNYWLDSRKTILPILIQDTPIHFRLKRVQFLDARANLEEAFKALLQFLSSYASLQQGRI